MVFLDECFIYSIEIGRVDLGSIFEGYLADFGWNVGMVCIYLFSVVGSLLCPLSYCRDLFIQESHQCLVFEHFLYVFFMLFPSGVTRFGGVGSIFLYQ